MSAKVQNIYECTKCGAQFSKWSGRCLECESWGTLQSEIKETKSDKEIIADKIRPAELINLGSLKSLKTDRLSLGWPEIDRVLGGGMVPGSLILFSGEPGIGKSTFLAQITGALVNNNYKTTYVSGEESAIQVKGRLERLNLPINEIQFANETNLEKILGLLRKIKPDLVVIDSIQTIYSSLVDSDPGSLNQIRSVAVQFLEIAKKLNITIVLIGHITKDGQVAGPKSLEHIVDTVLYLESDLSGSYTILRSTKNRFGSINEVGLFEMTGQGFIDVKEGADIFINKDHLSIAGSVISCTIEGSRVFLLDIQALVSKTVFGYPQRKTSGVDLNRLQVLSAVISKRTKLSLITQDIILNIVGGFKINDPALDLAICLTIISSSLNKKIDRQTLVLGEVGLGGEVRPVNKLEARVKAAQKLGFNRIILCDSQVKLLKSQKDKLEIVGVKEIKELLEIIKKGD